MNTRQYARAALALITAYAVALQAILLVVGPVFGAAQRGGAQSICFGSGAPGSNHSPMRPGHECIASCLACCCGAPATAGPAAAVLQVLASRSPTAGLPDGQVVMTLNRTGAHRSRAPPLR